MRKTILLSILLVGATSVFAQSNKYTIKLDSISYYYLGAPTYPGTIYEYNNDGLCLKEINNDRVKTYEYNADKSYGWKITQNGTVLEEKNFSSINEVLSHVVYDSEGKVQKKYSATFDEQNRLITEEAVTYNKEKDQQITDSLVNYEYDTDGTIIRTVTLYDVVGNPHKTAAVYNTEGKQVGEVNFAQDENASTGDNSTNTKILYVFDSAGKLSGHNMYIKQADKWILFAKGEMTYSEDGLTSTELFSSSSDGTTWAPVIKRENVYDAQGNVLSETVYKNNNGVYTINNKKEYKYYSNGVNSYTAEYDYFNDTPVLVREFSYFANGDSKYTYTTEIDESNGNVKKWEKSYSVYGLHVGTVTNTSNFSYNVSEENDANGRLKTYIINKVVNGVDSMIYKDCFNYDVYKGAYTVERYVTKENKPVISDLFVYYPTEIVDGKAGDYASYDIIVTKASLDEVSDLSKNVDIMTYENNKLTGKYYAYVINGKLLQYGHEIFNYNTVGDLESQEFFMDEKVQKGDVVASIDEQATGKEVYEYDTNVDASSIAWIYEHQYARKILTVTMINNDGSEATKKVYNYSPFESAGVNAATVASEQTVGVKKMIQNGQLFIVKNGKTYSAAGQQIK